MVAGIVFIVVCVVVAVLVVRHQKKLALRAHLMQEAIANRDFTFRLPTRGMLFGERAMQEALNQLGATVRKQVDQNEVETWERLTRVLTHEMMNATAPITSISQSLLGRPGVKGTPLEEGVRAICDTSRHLSEFVSNYRKMSELEKPHITDVSLDTMLGDVSRAYPQQTWTIDIPAGLTVRADAGMLRQVLMNLAKNAAEAGARAVVAEALEAEHHESTGDRYVTLYIGNDGLPIPAENHQSLFVPFFTTKQRGSGIGLPLSRRLMMQQEGMLDLAEKPREGCRAGFVLSIPLAKS